MTTEHPIVGHEDVGTYRNLLLGHVSHLTDVGIELYDASVVAAYEPQLLAQWLQHAYRVAALDDLDATYDDAIDHIRNELTSGIRANERNAADIDSSASWLANLLTCQQQTKAALQAEITKFRQISQQISDSGSFDLAWVNTPGDRTGEQTGSPS